MPKKILIFSYAFLPLVGGAEIAVKEITDRISQSDALFDMVTRRFSASDPAYERIGNVNVYRISASPYLFPFFAYFKALSLNRKNHYSAIWSIMANYAGFAALFFKFTHPKIPFLLTLQEGDPLEHIKEKVRFIGPIFRQIFKRADRVQAISHYLLDFARQMGATCPAEVIPNGVDVKKFSVVDLGMENALREKLILRGSDRIVITTSRLVEKNGVGDIIAAMEHLPADVKLLILGSGPLEASLQAQADLSKAAKRIHFLGTVVHENIPAYLHISNVFCRPSLSEGMGNSFVEAMAAGVPVVATNVGGIPDFLTDGETGLFCTVNDPLSIAKKINSLFEDRGLSVRIIESAKKMVAQKYDWELVARRMDALFQSL